MLVLRKRRISTLLLVHFRVVPFVHEPQLFTTDHPLNAGYTKQKRLLKIPPSTIGVQNNRVFCNALTDFGSLEYQQKPSMELET